MKRRMGVADVVNGLAERGQGRLKLFENDLDDKVQQYIKSIRKCGGVVSSGVVMAAAQGILLHILCQRKAGEVCKFE